MYHHISQTNVPPLSSNKQKVKKEKEPSNTQDSVYADTLITKVTWL